MLPWQTNAAGSGAEEHEFKATYPARTPHNAAWR